MAEKKSSYGNENITALKGADRVRKRPGVIFGSDGLEGCEHAVFEILSNSIDEAREGHGNVITVTRFMDRSVQIEDHGRGCPVDWNPVEKKFNWELVYCEMYAGGKYNTNDGQNYEYSLGLNGLGSCATQYTAEYMDVTVKRDGFIYRLNFKKGKNVTKAEGKLIKEPYSGRDTGTVHRWRPDLEVFTDIDIPLEYYVETLKKQAVVNEGIKFVLKNEIAANKFETSEFLYTNGISDYVAELAGMDAVTPVHFIKGERKGHDREDKPEYKVKLSVAFCFSNKEPSITYFHNSSWLEHGGAPEKATRSAFVSAIKAYLKQTKFAKDADKLVFSDVADSLVMVSSSFSTLTSYENQTKKAITNKFIAEAMTEFLRSSLEVYFIENRAEADKIAETVMRNRQIRESAESARQTAKTKLSGNVDITSRIEKFVDCRSRDVSRRELYIVEGDSALGSCKLGRDAEFQAIMPVRGKILNCLKVELPRIFKSEIITNLIKVFGCGVEAGGKGKDKGLSAFNLSALRWSKIIICTDADEDGFQIRTLILAMLYRLVPTLINEGLVYIAESPLYEITCKDETFFAYNEKEKAEITDKLEGKKYTVQRSKGLGENEPEMMWLTTMSPATRRLIKVMPTDAEATAEMFDLMLGDNIQGRKDYIATNGSWYLELADIS
ncbi:MAG: DNA topoisomerase [Clostridia bacterium]|nr:DNA topoisomerase [Clostridia bacterium]